MYSFSFFFGFFFLFLLWNVTVCQPLCEIDKTSKQKKKIVRWLVVSWASFLGGISRVQTWICQFVNKGNPGRTNLPHLGGTDETFNLQQCSPSLSEIINLDLNLRCWFMKFLNCTFYIVVFCPLSRKSEVQNWLQFQRKSLSSFLVFREIEATATDLHNALKVLLSRYVVVLVGLRLERSETAWLLWPMYFSNVWPKTTLQSLLDGQANLHYFYFFVICKLSSFWTCPFTKWVSGAGRTEEQQMDDGGLLFIFWFQLFVFLDCKSGMSETFPPFLSWVRSNRINVQQKSRFTVCFAFLCIIFIFSRLNFNEKLKSMMVPSSSPFQVLLKSKAVRGEKSCSFLNFSLLGADGNNSIHTIYVLQRQISLFLYCSTKMICCELCTFFFAVICILLGFVETTGACSFVKWLANASKELSPPSQQQKVQ